MKQITDNENQNFEILSEEISEFPELEVLNSNDRKVFEVFLDFWNVNVYPKFVMLAQQGSKDGAAKAVELVRRTKSVIDLYNQKVKNYQLCSSADVPVEYKCRFNEVYGYFESFVDKKKKLNRNELDIFEEKINEYYVIINPPRKISRGSSSTYEKPAAEAVRPQSNDFHARQAPNRMPYQEPNYFQGDTKNGSSLNKPAPFNLAIPFGLFCFFVGAGIAGPLGAAIGLALGLLAASMSETGPRSGGAGRYRQPPSDDVLNELKNAESVRGDLAESQTRVSHIAAQAVAQDSSAGDPLKYESPKAPGGIGCFSILVCMIAGANVGGVTGFVVGSFIGFFLGSLIADILNKNYKDIEGGFLFNGFLIGMVFGVYFDHIVFGIIIGLIAAKIAASALIKK